MIRTTETSFVEPITIYRVQVEWDTSDLGFFYEPIRRDTMRFIAYFANKEEAMEALKTPILEDMEAQCFDWKCVTLFEGADSKLESNYYNSQKEMITARSRARKAMYELYKTIKQGGSK